MKKVHYIILCLFISLLSNIATANNSNSFTRFKIEQVKNLRNLRSSEILKLCQDSDGFMWIATTTGLYQFDGYNITEYRSNIYNPALLSNNRINYIFESSNKQLYIGTNKGLNILDKRTGVISLPKKKSLKEYVITCISESKSHTIWFTSNQGTYIYYPEQDSIKTILEHNSKTLYPDPNGDMWIGTWDKGLFRYDHKTKEIVSYPSFNKQNSAHVITKDSKGRIWVGSFGGGITLLHNPYDTKEVTWTNFTADDRENNISDNYIYAITENEETHTLLFGTRKGISIIDMYSEEGDQDFKWRNLLYSDEKNSLPFNEVDAIINDKHGNIWVGTLGGGIFSIRTQDLGFHVNKMQNVLHTLSSNSVRSILVDDKDQIWTGVGTNGLAIHGKERNEIFTDIDWNHHSDIFTRINTIHQSQNQKDILLGTQKGLYRYNSLRPNEGTTNIQLPYKMNLSIKSIIAANDKGYWISGRTILCHLDSTLQHCHKLPNVKGENVTMLQDDSNRLWTGSDYNGIECYHFKPNSLNPYKEKHYSPYKENIPSSNICYLFQDSKKRIWAATDGAGLCLFNEETDQFVSLNTVIDFPTDFVTSIAEDQEGALWLGSNIGLIKFYPADNLKESYFRIFDKRNGLPDNHFMRGAVATSTSKELYFGTYQGYIHFYPENIANVKKDNNVFITDFLIDNRSQKLPEIIGYTSHVVVPGNYSNFTIKYSPMEFLSPEKVRYAYKLEGYDTDWQYSSSNNCSAHYTNLPAGDYQFQLKATDEYGNWNPTVRKLSIQILPPLWKTWWAYLIYSALFLAIAIYLYRSAKQRIKLRTAIRIQQIEKDKSDELNQAKLRFFTNITHELFTPITIISASIEENKSLMPAKEYEVIMNNTHRLTRLIQQILEFRKAETGNLKLQVSKNDLVQFIQQNIESFQPLMKQKHIQIEMASSLKTLDAYFDTDKLDKIIYNLLSNALKYNGTGATVICSLAYNPATKMAIISVKDNGKGLSERTMNNLFKRFYDGDFRKFKTSGTGIGLSLVKDLVTLHKGEINVENHPGHGVNFIISIPISASAYAADENLEEKPKIVITQEIDDEMESVPTEKTVNVLVVEDNPDLLLLMRNILAKTYNIFTATNGVEAIEILKSEEINLIISDVMMPEMDGYELCSKVKQDIEFNHIPIILLTAKMKEDDEINAYQSGADAYLTKPFSVNVLQARISNLLKAQQQRITDFQAQKTFEPQELNYTTPDEDFLKKIMETIYEHYSDPDFDQNQLSESMNLSKSTVYRKLKTLTGMTTGNLIKDVRLKKAHELLMKKGNSRISEIAYLVGFNDPKYFSLCFKKEFGRLPSELDTTNTDAN